MARRVSLTTICFLLSGLAPVTLFLWLTQPPPAHSQQPAIRRPAAELSQRRRARRPRPKPAQQQPTPARIREIQQALIREGYLAGQPTGKWDAATSDAMRRYQQAHGHPITGKPDALSLIKLGLGAKTAGQAPPRPNAANAKPPPN